MAGRFEIASASCGGMIGILLGCSPNSDILSRPRIPMAKNNESPDLPQQFCTRNSTPQSMQCQRCGRQRHCHRWAVMDTAKDHAKACVAQTNQSALAHGREYSLQYHLFPMPEQVAAQVIRLKDADPASLSTLQCCEEFLRNGGANTHLRHDRPCVWLGRKAPLHTNICVAIHVHAMCTSMRDSCRHESQADIMRRQQVRGIIRVFA